MKTIDYVKQLARGALRNTTLAELRNGTGSHQDEFASVCTMIDEGLLRLYNRFIIKERHTIIEVQTGVTFYHLKSMYSVTGANPMLVPRPYIMDLPNEPFLEDVIKVLNVFDGCGKQKPLNDHSRPDGLFTPQPDTLQYACARDGEVLGVAYQAKPLSVLATVNGAWSEATEFYLPDCLFPALTSYITYSYLQSVGTPESSSNALVQLRMYEDVCSEVERMDLVNQSMSCTNTRFTQNGWV